MVMIVRPEVDRKLTFSSFFPGWPGARGDEQSEIFGHIIRDDPCDDDDVWRQCYKLYAQANMLAHKFHMCTDDVKTALFRAYRTTLYTAHLWCSYSKAKMKRLQLAFSDTLRILLKLPRWTSASHMFVTRNVPTFHAVLRNFMFRFMCRLTDPKNVIIMTLTEPTEDTFLAFGNTGTNLRTCFNYCELMTCNGYISVLSLFCCLYIVFTDLDQRVWNKVDGLINITKLGILIKPGSNKQWHLTKPAGQWIRIRCQSKRKKHVLHRISDAYRELDILNEWVFVNSPVAWNSWSNSSILVLLLWQNRMKIHSNITSFKINLLSTNAENDCCFAP